MFLPVGLKNLHFPASQSLISAETCHRKHTLMGNDDTCHHLFIDKINYLDMWGTNDTLSYSSGDYGYIKGIVHSLIKMKFFIIYSSSCRSKSDFLLQKTKETLSFLLHMKCFLCATQMKVQQTLNEIKVNKWWQLYYPLTWEFINMSNYAI